MCWRNILRKHEKAALPVRMMEAEKVYIEIRDEANGETGAQTATALAATMQKPAVVLYLKKGRTLSVQSWASANP